LAALLNAYPLGFYHPDTLVKDAQRHGVRVRPIDVTCSDWGATLEDTTTVRLGLRYVLGLRQVFGERIVVARQQAAFTDLADFERRCQLPDPDLAALAELGAFAALGSTRRQALWQVARLRERTQGLLGEADPAPSPSPLDEMGLAERIFADHKNSEMSVGPHPMILHRAALTSRGILPAAVARELGDGQRVKVAGIAITRQRPRTAKGIFFITLEDETGFANLIVSAEEFKRLRQVLVTRGALCVTGRVQKKDGVIHIKVDDAVALEQALEGGATAGDVSTARR
jgi:error-prone DNA polymerase